MNSRNSNQLRSIEKEFGFFIRHKNVVVSVRRMAEEIKRLRDSKAKLVEENAYLKGQMRKLELQISDLDFKLRA